jgi:MFS family permease
VNVRGHRADAHAEWRPWRDFSGRCTKDVAPGPPRGVYPAGREKYLLFLSVALAGVSLFVMLSAPTLPVVIVCQLILSFSMKISFIALWSFPLKLIEAKDMGMASGIVNLGSQLAGVASPAVMGFLIVARHGSYDGAFAFLAACTVICAIVTLTLPGKRVTSSHHANVELAPKKP